jgi:N-acyl-D-amino-acid deacylase
LNKFDLIIKNVNIVEGTGKAPYIGNIGIKEDKICKLGTFKEDAATLIEGSNLTALPGLIDAHSHGD